VVLATTHVAVKHLPRLLTRRLVLDTILAADDALRTRFGVRRPRLAVCGLNPHAGEDGLFGSEDQRVIRPAVAEARRRRVDALGPLPADTVFAPAIAGAYDCVVSMYHDQGLAPFKLVHFADGVNVTLGLPFVRTSPDHGTAFDIAGKGVADPSSMIAAIRLAADLVG
jgi:4-hydroxythreonine-4-phosphate dehydrogenase